MAHEMTHREGSQDDAASTTGQLHFPKLVVITDVRGQGGKPKAGAWTPSSIDCLRNMYTSEMCVRAAARVLCLRVSSLNFNTEFSLYLYTAGYPVETEGTCSSTGCTVLCGLLSRSNLV